MFWFGDNRPSLLLLPNVFLMPVKKVEPFLDVISERFLGMEEFLLGASGGFRWSDLKELVSKFLKYKYN